MFVRASRLKLNQNAHQQVHLSPNDLYLPWLCPALFTDRHHPRASSTFTRWQPVRKNPVAVAELKRFAPSASAETRGLASAITLDYASPAPDYVPFENQAHSQLPKDFHFHWMETNKSPPSDYPGSSAPLIIKDSLITRSPRFRSLDAITSELHDIVSTMKACLHVGRFERAATLMQRLNSLYKPDAPALLAAHKDYIREFVWKVISARDQDLLNKLQNWFEVGLRGQGIIPDADIYALMIQAALQDISSSKSSRSVRRYLHLADESGLRDELMNALLTILNEQDVGRVTRIDPPPPNSVPQASPLHSKSSPLKTFSNESYSQLPEVRPVDSSLAGWRALRQSLSIFSNPSDLPPLNTTEGTPEENAKRLGIERQLRIEQDTYESAVDRWRSDAQQLKRIGINGALKHNSFGTIMWDWHQALEPAIRKEIKLANEAEGKPLKKAADEDRCHYGPFLQYLDPKKISAITIVQSMTILATAPSGDRGVPLTRVVMKIGDAIQDESIAQHLRKTRSNRNQISRQASGPEGLTEQSKTKSQNVLTLLSDSPSTSGQAQQIREGQRWSSSIRARVGAVLLAKFIESAKISVHRKEASTGRMLSESQPALFHRFLYGTGRRIGMLSLNSSIYSQLAREPIATSLTQKYLPMLIEPKPWTGYREGGFLTSTEPMVRLPQEHEQGKRYCSMAVASGDMTQISAGLDVLSKTPWHINGPVFEVMLEAWNSGEAIGGIAPDNPDVEYPPEPALEDKRAYASYLRQVKAISNEKASYKSERCNQNFQMDIARAYRKETFYFPHNIDFRGRAYPMPPFLNYMGADLARGMLTFGIGKPLGTNGLRWLKIQLANVFGYDKASFEERVSFVEDHLQDISDSADQPLAGQRWWLQAEDPWQCLAACKELRSAMKSPDPQNYVSKLAIHQDGTCNGLQHYAALGGDSSGAKQVNLEPGDRPSDIYSGVAELVRAAVAEDAKGDHELAKYLAGKVTRKVVKQPVMTNVYGVTFMGAKLQVVKQLKDLYPDMPQGRTVNYSAAGLYIARKIFQALANMFNGAHDIQYWLGECANRITTAVTPEQIHRMEAALTGNLKEPSEFRKKPLTRKEDRGHKDELLSFKQSVIWTTPLKMPVVQPYRKAQGEKIHTILQQITLNRPSLADPVDKRKQLQAFPPNFIHSLDATHMILSALQCQKQGLTFTAVHDSYWTHAADVETMNQTLRDTFITMHSEDIIGRLGAEFATRYRDCMYMAAVKGQSHIGKRITAWRCERGLHTSQSYTQLHSQKVQKIAVDEIMLERQRQKLLASSKPEERKEGEEMVTPYSIFEQGNGEADLAVEESLEDVALVGHVYSARENKLQADEKLEVGDEGNIGSTITALGDELLDLKLDDEAGVEPVKVGIKAKAEKTRAKYSRTVWLWRPLTFPPVPKKVMHFPFS
ncbi:MAG: hypothetical protein Q9170_005580 [Blastenia crenularia]